MGRLLTTTTACSVIAASLVVSVTTSTAHQDIAEMTGTETASAGRWMSRLVAVPTGSDVAMIGDEKAGLAASPISERKVLGVRTTERLHLLDRNSHIDLAQLGADKNSLKGGRVYKPTPSQVASVKLEAVTHGYAAPATALLTKSLQKETKVLTAAFQRAEAAAKEAATNTNSIMPKTAMLQARSAARQMAKAQPLEEIAGDVIVAAYAPSATPAASAFDAVLRPGLPKAAAKKTSPIVKAAVPTARKTKRSVIRLAKGDHKWAAKPLPKKSFGKSERRCLATGIYFEARGESKNGQKAVAQVILNRVKNPAYPNSICGVVYQNKHKRNACQFSFACDGIRDKVGSRKHWKKSVNVANDAIDGKFWLTSIGSSSHYHADYVWPKWRKNMRKMTKIGRHIFYRTYGGGWS
ncbi:cell wall hydrolase [Ahrensia sp. R2A130]|uniref:cell wall hydrolase n=1 Tax=Ahrensia sp. R2A130 TaxID=744979 RepID=UPI0001E0F04F|nr:cell wall hydrolase [Ahrensia sp. R2A130]EFL90965.1 cell wall hydrolase SleB [Ahrensia sp. R2A130]